MYPPPHRACLVEPLPSPLSPMRCTDLDAVTGDLHLTAPCPSKERQLTSPVHAHHVAGAIHPRVWHIRTSPVTTFVPSVFASLSLSSLRRLVGRPHRFGFSLKPLRHTRLAVAREETREALAGEGGVVEVACGQGRPHDAELTLRARRGAGKANQPLFNAWRFISCSRVLNMNVVVSIRASALLLPLIHLIFALPAHAMSVAGDRFVATAAGDEALDAIDGLAYGSDGWALATTIAVPITGLLFVVRGGHLMRSAPYRRLGWAVPVRRRRACHLPQR